ncbi:MAG TPA: response regulator [Ramlibacter sp.]|jgi:CheY-like chemotaxis protein|uniref:response regulator n=1 Tax=Ramlibacter sp. TaxID=1917967 RepID=UPI002D6950BC|nr:response regulator [Ramlibacter sp.]HZY20248.1 response regulator [Ramlibacter sp.]
MTPADPIPTRAPASPSQAPLGAAAPQPVILLVEDDSINQMVGQVLLQTLGYTDVHTAADGHEALAFCAAHEPDLVLMDCLMPRMGGLEATRRLRQAGFRKPVVALTGSTDPQDVAECLQAGMDDHLAKPIDAQRLGEVVARWLGRCAVAPQPLN